MTPEEHCEWHGLNQEAALIRRFKERIKRVPNHQDWERLDLQAEEIAALKRELGAAQSDAAQLMQDLALAIAGNAKVIHALDCAIIWAEALFAWLPEGTVMPEGIQAAKNNLTRALAEMRK